MPKSTSIPQRIGDPDEIDYSMPIEDDLGELSRDRIPVRSMTESDLPVLVAELLRFGLPVAQDTL